MSTKFYVWRICYDSPEWYSRIRNELLNGTLVQGWSPEGAILTSRSIYIDTLVRDWNYSVTAATDRFDILKPIREIEEGDFIIVPKVSVFNPHIGRYSTICRATGIYRHGVPFHDHNDFCSLLPVKPITTVSFDSVVGNLRGYQKAINRVNDYGLQQAVLSVVRSSTHQTIRNVVCVSNTTF